MSKLFINIYIFIWIIENVSGLLESCISFVFHVHFDERLCVLFLATMLHVSWSGM